MATRKSNRIADKCKQDQVTYQSQHPLPSATQTRKSGAEGTRDWKVRLKTGNPKKYSNYMEYSKEYSRQYRYNMTDSQRSVSNENAAARMQRMRQRNSATAENSTEINEMTVRVQFLTNIEAPPHYLYLHCVGNDVGNPPAGDLRFEILETIHFLANKFPHTRLVWSQILPRLTWRHSDNKTAMFCAI